MMYDNKDRIKKENNNDKKKDIGETLTQVLRRLRKNQKKKLLK